MESCLLPPSHKKTRTETKTEIDRLGYEKEVEIVHEEPMIGYQFPNRRPGDRPPRPVGGRAQIGKYERDWGTEQLMVPPSHKRQVEVRVDGETMVEQVVPVGRMGTGLVLASDDAMSRMMGTMVIGPSQILAETRREE